VRLPTEIDRGHHRCRGMVFPTAASAVLSQNTFCRICRFGLDNHHFLQTFPEEVEAALEGGFHLTDSGVDGIVNFLEELSNLVDAE